MRSIRINNIKGIRELSFKVPERNDVYLLVGANGTGKSTLLICLDRLCNNLAFSHGFSFSRNTVDVDQYTSSSVIYATDTHSIRFHKGPARWVSSPKKGSSSLLRSFGFRVSIFIKADSRRLEVTSEELRNGEYIQADASVRTALNAIFETSRFNNLYLLRITHGRGRSATLFYVIRNENDNYSEKRFSSGELALVRLIEQIHTVSADALVLIDEAELALHPRIQRNLLNYIREKSREKNLMVFIATHSTTMINMTNKNNIILLQNNSEGITDVVYSCYPAKAIGGVDYIENSGFDYIFFVEDDMARLLLKKMLSRYITLEPRHSTASTCIIPIGGYEQTALFAVNTRHQLFGNIKAFAVLDADAFVEGQQNQTFWALYQNNQSLIKSLGCTPEMWIVEQIESDDAVIDTLLRDVFRVERSQIIENAEYQACTSNNPRKLAKKKLDKVVNAIAQHTGDNEEIVTDQFASKLIDTLSDGRVREIIGPMLNSARA